MYNVFTDFHHASLLNSLIMLFEGRLGGNVYRPIGTDWYHKGFWKVYDHPATVEQYLGIGGNTPDGSPPLNQLTDRSASVFNSGVYLCRDIDSGQTNTAITFEAFMSNKIDIVIASLPQHIGPFRKLCELHPNHPKFIYQIGNAWNVPAGEGVKNVMASALIHDPIPPGTHFISYHQEFDTRVFSHKPLAPSPWICSFVNCFSTDALFSRDWALFQEVEESMDTFTFKCFGAAGRDGSIGPSQKLSDAMNVGKFIWHTKYGGDGYGHIIYNSAAVGRPLITKIGYYMGKMGQELMQDGVTCIGIDGLSPQQIKEKIEYYSEPMRYEAMCQNIQTNFKQKVDFDREFIQLQTFLKNLL